MSNSTLLFGSLNILNYKKPEFSTYFDGKDPKDVSANLRMTEVRENVFPGLITGVRWWPFLLVARDNGNYRAIANKKIINKGPRAISTFQPYRSMAKTIFEDSILSSRYAKMRKFLCKKKFTGKSSKLFSKKTSTAWKKILLKTLGNAAKEFSKYLIKNDNDVELAITDVIKNPRLVKSKDLIKACLCYQIFRCLYGISIDKNTIDSNEKIKDFINMKKILKK